MLERALLIAGAVIWLIAAVAPKDRATWLLENFLLAVGVSWIIATYRRWRLSSNSYILLFIFFVLHVAGAHYTYSQVPLGHWLQTWIGSGRNHYDRAVHFLFGLLIISPFRDQVERATPLGTKAAWGVSMLIIISLSTMYELMEWAAAEIFNPGDAVAFLGSQGDVFDAQKDMSLAILGGAVGILVAMTYRRLHWGLAQERQLELFAEPDTATD